MQKRVAVLAVRVAVLAVLAVLAASTRLLAELARLGTRRPQRFGANPARRTAARLRAECAWRLRPLRRELPPNQDRTR
jgi:hypothetical protein